MSYKRVIHKIKIYKIAVIYSTKRYDKKYIYATRHPDPLPVTRHQPPATRHPLAPPFLRSTRLTDFSITDQLTTMNMQHNWASAGADLKF